MPNQPFIEIVPNPQFSLKKNPVEEEPEKHLGPDEEVLIRFPSIYDPALLVSLGIALIIFITLLVSRPIEQDRSAVMLPPQGMILRENGYLKKVTSIIPVAAIYVIIGTLLSFAVDGIVKDLEFDPVNVSRTNVKNALIAPVILHHSYNLYHPKFMRKFRQIFLFGVGNFIITSTLTALII
jgi:hypothetical protein